MFVNEKKIFAGFTFRAVKKHGSVVNSYTDLLTGDTGPLLTIGYSARGQDVKRKSKKEKETGKLLETSSSSAHLQRLGNSFKRYV
jgi:hypothetical protein